MLKDLNREKHLQTIDRITQELASINMDRMPYERSRRAEELGRQLAARNRELGQLMSPQFQSSAVTADRDVVGDRAFVLLKWMIAILFLAIFMAALANEFFA